MAMVRCDACGAMLDPKGFRKRHRTEGDLEIDFFTCGRCGKEYIGFLSDGDLRQMLWRIRRKRLKIRLMIQKGFRRGAIRKEEKALERMRKRAIQKEQNLKRRYEEGGGTLGQAAEKGPQTADSAGIHGVPDRGDTSGQVSGHNPSDGDNENGLEQDAGNVLLLRAPNEEHSE
ncbi:MAG: hypothetical protein IJ206_09270 [Oscillospiraceae bacterium]|nr:hypothetical protein [Oscillospiraceae bacterium]